MGEAGTPADARYAPPRSHVDDIAAPEEAGGLATRMQRFWAAMLDLGIGLGLMAVASAVTPWNPWSAEGGWWTPQWLNIGLSFLLFSVVHGVPLARRGQTVGKMVLGIRIVRIDGSRASLGRLLGLRYGIGTLATVIPAIGQPYALVDALLIFRKSRRCLHDVIADTVVLKA
ncbi:RDD family protein [Ramlibacter albus]|uniref:RDD family protein n=1 Tax=Ramlibacter albus TaxID=2079448 RepID=A0A923M6A3_9BURK|nr:RDD family protein [Ramlibacter albus]MBC5763693.1 RDD family protein [Ramlibacter albus]